MSEPITGRVQTPHDPELCAHPEGCACRCAECDGPGDTCPDCDGHGANEYGETCPTCVTPGRGLSDLCRGFRHDLCVEPLRCGCACHACSDTLDGIPCHGDKGHDGDHWNFYADRRWPVIAPARVTSSEDG